MLQDTEGNLVDRGGVVVEDSSLAIIPAGQPFWWLDAGNTRVEGTIVFVGRGEGRLAVQLINQDAVNLLLVMPEEGEEEREVEEALLAIGRGPTSDHWEIER